MRAIRPNEGLNLVRSFEVNLFGQNAAVSGVSFRTVDRSLSLSFRSIILK